MMVHLQLLLAATAFSAALAQNTHIIDVGQDLTFSPSSLNAKKGDTLEFRFLPEAHSVTQSTFLAPCTPMPGGYDSGFHPVNFSFNTAPAFFPVTDDSKPLWFYCKQTSPTSHCGAGMVLAVNAPQTGNTFQAFQLAANMTAGNMNGSSSVSASGSAGDSGAGSTSSSASFSTTATSIMTTAVPTGAAATLAGVGPALLVMLATCLVLVLQ